MNENLGLDGTAIYAMAPFAQACPHQPVAKGFINFLPQVTSPYIESGVK
jgi:hypothetical protein